MCAHLLCCMHAYIHANRHACCLYRYMYACIRGMHAHTHIYLLVEVYRHKPTYTYIYIYTQVYIHTSYTPRLVHICMETCTRIHTSTERDNCLHIYREAGIHTCVFATFMHPSTIKFNHTRMHACLHWHKHRLMSKTYARAYIRTGKQPYIHT